MTTRTLSSDTGNKECDGQCVCGGGMGEQHEGGENMTTRTSSSDTGNKERDGQCVEGGGMGEQHLSLIHI